MGSIPLRPLITLLLLAFAACSDDGPIGPGNPPDGMGRISGQLTAGPDLAANVGHGLAPAGQDALAGVQVTILDGDGDVILSTATDLEGEFEGTIPAGTYTVLLELDPETEFSFSLDVPEGTTFFVEGELDVTPSGKFKLDAEIFVDDDGDSEPDNSFVIRITGRLAGQPQSGDLDIGGAEDKVALCHFPPGNPENFHTIVVGPDAVDGHIAHGDTEGPCDPDDLEDGNGEEDGEGGEKVVLCHIPPGSPENAHTVEVSESAVEAHLAHGDIEGACP